MKNSVFKRPEYSNIKTNQTQMPIIIRLIISAVAIMLTALLVPGATVTFVPALIAAIILAVLNTFIKPVLLVLTLPINILTLGLFTFIINGLILLLASKLVPGFYIGGLWSAVLFAIVLAVINMVFFRAVK